jgi:hypothetical protein
MICHAKVTRPEQTPPVAGGFHQIVEGGGRARAAGAEIGKLVGAGFKPALSRQTALASIV